MAYKRNVLDDLKNVDPVTYKKSYGRNTQSITKQAFTRAGLKYEDVAKECGVSTGTVQNWVNKNQFPPDAMAVIYFKWFKDEDFTDVFDVDFDWWVATAKEWKKWEAVGFIIFDQSVVDAIYPDNDVSVDEIKAAL